MIQVDKHNGYGHQPQQTQQIRIGLRATPQQVTPINNMSQHAQNVVKLVYLTMDRSMEAAGKLFNENNLKFETKIAARTFKVLTRDNREMDFATTKAGYGHPVIDVTTGKIGKVLVSAFYDEGPPAALVTNGYHIQTFRDAMSQKPEGTLNVNLVSIFESFVSSVAEALREEKHLGIGRLLAEMEGVTIEGLDKESEFLKNVCKRYLLDKENTKQEAPKVPPKPSVSLGKQPAPVPNGNGAQRVAVAVPQLNEDEKRYQRNCINITIRTFEDAMKQSRDEFSNILKEQGLTHTYSSAHNRLELRNSKNVLITPPLVKKSGNIEIYNPDIDSTGQVLVHFSGPSRSVVNYYLVYVYKEIMSEEATLTNKDSIFAANGLKGLVAKEILSLKDTSLLEILLEVEGIKEENLLQSNYLRTAADFYIQGDEEKCMVLIRNKKLWM